MRIGLPNIAPQVESMCVYQIVLYIVCPVIDPTMCGGSTAQREFGDKYQNASLKASYFEIRKDAGMSKPADHRAIQPQSDQQA